MKPLSVPIYAEGLVDDYEQYMAVYRNGEREVVDAPYPFFYTKFSLLEAPESVSSLFIRPASEKVELTVAGEKEPSVWYQHEFSSEVGPGYIRKIIREMSKRTDRTAEEVMSYLGSAAAMTGHLNTRYTDQVMITNPDYYRQYPSEKYTAMWFDIEQHSTGEGFEQTKKNSLISIVVAWQTVGGLLQFREMECEVLDDGRPHDKEMLREFVTLFKEIDPDIIVGYNCNGYDLPVLISRMAKHGFNTKIFDREGKKEPYFSRGRIGVNDVDKCYMRGRVIYDVFHAVMQDQTLNGQVKNRKLKTIAKYYQAKGNIPPEVEIVEEDMIDNTELIGTEKLLRYNKSDVVITKHLFDLYFPNNVAVAEFVGCPLQQVVPLATSYPFTIETARVFHENKILSTGKNVDKNYQYFPRGGGVKPYEGAHVECFRTGRFSPCYEVDVASLYPHIITSIGIGSDNTKIIDTQPYSSLLRVEVKGNVKTYYVPDEERQWTWVIEVTGYSKVAERLASFLEERMRIKKKADLTGDADAYNAYVRAYGLKVVLNSAYGLMGAMYNDYGELGAAALITAVGRYILDSATTWVGRENCVVEDTDGIKVTKNVNIDELNAHTNKLVVNHLHGEPVFVWEKETFKSIYAHRMKNYLVLNEDDSMTIHGVAFKSSRSPPMFDHIIRGLGRKMLVQGHDAAKPSAMKYYSMADLEPRDYIMSVKLGKPMNEYANPDGNLACKVARQYEEQLGVKPQVGNQYEYIKTKRGYEPPNEESFRRLDKEYYKKVVDKAVTALGFDNIYNKTLEDFL